MYLKRILTYSILSLIALGGFFGNIHIETQENQMSSIAISYEGSTTYAASGETTSSKAVEAYNGMIDTINIILAVLSAMISPIILFVGWLMSPDWTSGDLFGLRTPMYKLWITVSNIVYFIYAILLILIALGTMFGQDKFSYKVMLPKLALGILMVPFTWWFVQWTISISSVVTASVMTIPTATIGENGSTWFTKPSIPKGILIDNRGGTGTTTKSDCEDIANSTCLSPEKFIGNAGGMYGPLIVYGYSVFKFERIDRLDSTLDIASAAVQLVHTSIVSTIMFAVFGLLTFALAAMLLVRAIKLWMYAIFAPLFTFRFVAGSNLMGGDDDSFTIKEFIGLAFVPAIVGLTLSFGLIMINAVHGSGSGTPKTCTLASDEGCVTSPIMGDANNKIIRKTMTDGNDKKFTSTQFQFGGIEVQFLGKAINQSNDSTTATGAIDAVGGMFGTLIVDVIALVFIWMAFMAAKNVSKAVKMAVQPFEDIGSKVGSLAKSMPKYTPIPGLGMSASGATKVLTNAENAMIGAHDEKFKSSAAGKLFGGDKVVAQVDEKRLADALKDVGTSSTNPAWVKAGEVIEKQTGKDIEYSSIFKDLTGKLKDFSSRNDKITALETAGYSNDNAKKVVDQLEKHNGEIDKNDATLMTALKSRIGTPSGGAAIGPAGFTQSTKKDTKGNEETHISLGDINLRVEKGGALSKDNIDKLIKGKGKWTEEEFDKNISSFTQDVQDGLNKAIQGQTDFFKKANTPTPPSSTPTPPAH